VRVVARHAVHDHVAIADLDRLALDRDDALHEVLAPVLRPDEYDDVARTRRASPRLLTRM
jgi:hypothetical protein